MVIGRRYTQGFTAVLVCLILQSGLASAAGNCGSVERIQAALGLSRALFPGLRGRELRVSISDGYLAGPAGATDGRAFRLFFERSTPSGQGSTDIEKDDIDLNNIQFNFVTLQPLNNDKTCPPVGLQILTHDGRIETAESLAIQHPQWSDDQLIAALKEQGLRSGPEDKAALMKTLPLARSRPATVGASWPNGSRLRGAD